MYELAGGCPFTSWTLLMVFMIMAKKIFSHTEIFCCYGGQEDIISYRNLLFSWYCPKKILSHTDRNVLFLWSCPKKILSHTEIFCFYGIVQRRYYLIQKSINTHSFHGYVQEDIISYRKI